MVYYYKQIHFSWCLKSAVTDAELHPGVGEGHLYSKVDMMRV